MLARAHTLSAAPLRLPTARSLHRRGAMRGLFSRATPSAALKVGDKLDDFPSYFRPLPSVPGNTLLALSSFKGKKTVVVFFYPKDDTPGCTKEACSFRDSYEAFVSAGAEVIGVSSDGRESHEAFRTRHRLPYTLLSDEKNFLRTDFGVPSDLFGMLPGRQTYVIDKDAKCRLVFNSQMEPEKHVTEALAVIKSIK